MIEARRAAHEAQTAFILASVNSKTTPQFEDFMMPFTKTQKHEGLPAWVRDDLRAGIMLGVISQEFVDALRTVGIEVS